MSNDLPRFKIRPLEPYFVVNALWPDGSSEQLVGMFTSEEAAERWVTENASSYIAQRNGARAGLSNSP